MSEKLEPLQTFNIISNILGLDNCCFMRQIKISRNPDVFTYNTSIDYKEDFDLIEGSFCDCGCKSAVYVKETGSYEDGYTEFKTQTEYEELPNKPKPTPEQVKLHTNIICTDREETELGIIHDQESCTLVPIPELEFRIPEGLK